MYDLFQAQTHLYDERKVRRSSSSSLEIIQYDFRADSDADKPAVAPVGSMVVYVARKGSAKLKALRSAALKNLPMPREILIELQAEYSPRMQASLEDSVQIVQAADVILDVTYSDHLVLSNFALVPGLSLVAVPLVYSGGEIDESSFQVVQYVKKGSKANLEVVAIINKPALNPAEVAALRKIPTTMRHLHVTGGVPDTSWCPAVTLVAYVITVTTICFHRRVSDVHLPDATIRQLPATTALRDLVALRLKALQGKI